MNQTKPLRVPLFTYRHRIFVSLSLSWDPNVEDYYYYNSKSGESQWKHPLDEVYRQKVVQAKMDMKPPAKLVNNLMYFISLF